MSTYVPRVRILTVSGFQGRFGTPEQCAAHLAKVRWPHGFVCPHCGGARACDLKRRCVFQCNDCRRQTSLTAGTIFQRSRVPLHKWFWAVYRLAQDKKGCSALLLSKELDVCYPTAWLMAHKIRHAMSRHNQPFALQGLVELDDAYLGGARPGHPGHQGRAADGKTPVLAAVEVRPDGKPGRAALLPVRNFRKPSVTAFVQACLQPGCTVKTDAMGGFSHLSQLGHEHRCTPIGADKSQASKRLPTVHMLISNLKRFVLGRHHAIAGKHAERYVGEFNYRFNRRREESSLFATLIQACARTQVITYPELCHAAAH